MRLTATLIALALLLGACGGDSDDSPGPTSAATTSAQPSPTPEPEEPSESAGDFYRTLLERLLNGQGGRIWDDLHPGQQAVVDRDFYVQCLADTVPSLPVFEVEVIETIDESITVARVGTVDAELVTMELRHDGTRERLSRHAVAHDGRWVWVLPDESVEALESGECPE